MGQSRHHLRDRVLRFDVHDVPARAGGLARAGGGGVAVRVARVASYELRVASCKSRQEDTWWPLNIVGRPPPVAVRNFRSKRDSPPAHDWGVLTDYRRRCSALAAPASGGVQRLGTGAPVSQHCTGAPAPSAPVGRGYPECLRRGYRRAARRGGDTLEFPRGTARAAWYGDV